MGLGQRLFQIGLQHGEIAGEAGLAPDQHMIMVGQTRCRQRLAQQDPEAPLHPVAHYCIAYLLGDGDAEAASIYSTAFNQDSEFYSFTRSLRAYQDAFRSKGDIILVEPDSDFFRYLNDQQGNQ